MIVDCDRCAVRGDACGECVITVLLGSPPGGLELDGADRRALDTLAAAGMVPQLQLVECDECHSAQQPSTDSSRTHCDERSVSGVRRPERHAG